MVHGPLKEPLDFGGNPDRVILGLGVSRGRDMLHVCVCVLPHLLSNNNFDIGALVGGVRSGGCDSNYYCCYSFSVLTAIFPVNLG